MNKRNLIVILIVLFIGGAALGYLLSGKGPEDPGSVGENRKSFRDLLPGEQKADLARHDDENPNVVVIKPGPHQLDIDYTIEKIESMKDMKEQQGLDYVKWALFSENAKYLPEEKERIYEKAIEVLPPEEVDMLNQHALFVGNVPDLYERALQGLTRNMDQQSTENLIREVLQKRNDPQVKSAVTDFAATRNIYIR